MFQHVFHLFQESQQSTCCTDSVFRSARLQLTFAIKTEGLDLDELLSVLFLRCFPSRKSIAQNLTGTWCASSFPETIWLPSFLFKPTLPTLPPSDAERSSVLLNTALSLLADVITRAFFSYWWRRLQFSELFFKAITDVNALPLEQIVNT